MDNKPYEHILEGQWNQVKGKVKEQWGKLTDNQLDQVAGKYDQLVGVLQETYGYSADKARKEVDHFISRLDKERY